jgi:PKD repeat protein
VVLLDADFHNNSYGANTYSWNFGDPSTTNDVSTLANPNYTYPDTGHYTVMLVAYGVNTNCNDTAWTDAYIFPAFFAKAGTLLGDCRRDFQFLDSSFVLNSNAVHWAWNFGDNSYSNFQNPAHHFSVPGNYVVTMIAYADSGCADTASILVDVDPVPECLFSATLDTCTQTVEFYNASTESNIYDWDFGDNTNETAAHPVHVYLQDGSFTVNLIASNDSGCSDTAQVTFDIPKVPIANFSWTITDCDSVAHFQNLSSNSTGYTWSFGDNSSTSYTDPSHLYEHSGNYTVTLEAFGNTSTCIAERQQTIEVNRRPLQNLYLRWIPAVLW